MKLIGFHGYARTGKDTVGEILVRERGYVRYAFADPIRHAAVAMFGLPLGVFQGTNPNRDEIDPFWGYSPRQMLQMIGTEGGRNVFGHALWIKRAEQEWHNIRIAVAERAEETFGPLPAGMVITDVRFDNEAEWIHSMGGLVVQVSRPGVGPQSDHPSEYGLSDSLIDFELVNDKDLKHLHELALGVEEMLVDTV